MSHHRVLADQLGDGYGHPTAAGREAQRLIARLEGIILDPTYTAKAMAGLIAGVRTRAYDSYGTIIFWHTGGSAGFFS